MQRPAWKSQVGALLLQEFLFHLINDSRVKELVQEADLLPQDSHGGPVRLDGPKALRRLYLPVHNELPDLHTSTDNI